MPYNFFLWVTLDTELMQARIFSRYVDVRSEEKKGQGRDFRKPDQIYTRILCGFLFKYQICRKGIHIDIQN
jgi:hypothetical protein